MQSVPMPGKGGVLIVQSKPPSVDAHVQVKAKWGVGTSPTHQRQQDDIKSFVDSNGT